MSNLIWTFIIEIRDRHPFMGLRVKPTDPLSYSSALVLFNNSSKCGV